MARAPARGLKVQARAPTGGKHALSMPQQAVKIFCAI